MIAIIAAMHEELQEVLSLMEDTQEERVYGVSFYHGSLAGKEVVAMLSGIAKINATFSTTLLLMKYAPDVVINVGSAGGLHADLQMLDVVVSTRVCQHDLDVGRAKGELGGQPRFFEADAKLISLASNLQLPNVRVHTGLIVSGDQFIVAKASSFISKEFPDALAVEMEAAAVGQSCMKANIPFVVIRSISDLTYEPENGMTFDEYLPIAAKHSAMIAKQLIEIL